MKNISNQNKAVFGLVVSCLFSVLMGVVIRVLTTQGFEIYSQIYLRVFGGVLLGLIFLKPKSGLKRFKTEKLGNYGFLFLRSMLFYIFGVVFFVRAYTQAKFSNVAFIQSIPTGAIFGFLLFREKITIGKILLLVCAVLGSILVSLETQNGSFQLGIGELYAMISTISFGFCFVSRKWYKGNLNDLEIAELMMIFGGLAIFLIAIISGEKMPQISDFGIVAIITLVAGAFLQIVNLVLYNYSFKHIENVIASNLLTLESFFGLVIGYLVYQEIPNFIEIVGGVLIVISAVFINLYHQKK